MNKKTKTDQIDITRRKRNWS